MESLIKSVFLGLAVVATLILVFRSKSPSLFSMWTAGIAASFFSYRLLIFTPIELVHFPQYALFGFWMVHLMADSGKSLFFVTILGVVDETVNYISNPSFTPYLDFNDMVLNFLGAFLGIIFYHAFHKKPFLKRQHYIFPILYVSLFLSLCLFTLGVATERIITVNYNKNPRNVLSNGFFVISFEKHTSFCSKALSKKCLHIIDPLEGIIGLGVLITGTMVLFGVIRHEDR